jgi:hypothetical protein
LFNANRQTDWRKEEDLIGSVANTLEAVQNLLQHSKGNTTKWGGIYFETPTAEILWCPL